MVRIFTTNPDGNIELTKEDLEKLLQEAYDEGVQSTWCLNQGSIKVIEEKSKTKESKNFIWLKNKENKSR